MSYDWHLRTANLMLGLPWNLVLKSVTIQWLYRLIVMCLGIGLAHLLTTLSTLRSMGQCCCSTSHRDYLTDRKR